MSLVTFIAFLRDQDCSFNLTGTEIHFASLDVEVPNGHAAHTQSTRKLHNGVIRHERRAGIRACHTVAGVAADGADVADLRASHHVHRLAEHSDMLLDDGASCDVGKARQCADADGSVRLHGNAAQFIQPVDGNECCARKLALADLDQHVAAARKHFRLRVCEQKRACVLHAFCFIQCFDVVHFASPFP